MQSRSTKSQGQTLKKVCFDVRDYPFAHGQLYVGTSRVRYRRDMLMLTRQNHVRDGHALTKNVVYSELRLSCYYLAAAAMYRPTQINEVVNVGLKKKSL